MVDEFMKGANGTVPAGSVVNGARFDTHMGDLVRESLRWSPEDEFRHRRKEYVLEAPQLIDTAAQASPRRRNRRAVAHLLPEEEPTPWPPAPDEPRPPAPATARPPRRFQTDIFQQLAAVVSIQRVWRGSRARRLLKYRQSRTRARRAQQLAETGIESRMEQLESDFLAEAAARRRRKQMERLARRARAVEWASSWKQWQARRTKRKAEAAVLAMQQRYRRWRKVRIASFAVLRGFLDILKAKRVKSVRQKEREAWQQAQEELRRERERQWAVRREAEERARREEEEERAALTLQRWWREPFAHLENERSTTPPLSSIHADADSFAPPPPPPPAPAPLPPLPSPEPRRSISSSEARIAARRVSLWVGEEVSIPEELADFADPLVRMWLRETHADAERGADARRRAQRSREAQQLLRRAREWRENMQLCFALADPEGRGFVPVEAIRELWSQGAPWASLTVNVELQDRACDSLLREGGGSGGGDTVSREVWLHWSYVGPVDLLREWWSATESVYGERELRERAEAGVGLR